MIDFNDIDIHGILPQQPPFVFVSRIIDCNEKETICEYTVANDCPLLQEDGTLCAEALMEIMAQTNAARTGYIAKYILKKNVDIGYIGDIKGFSQTRLPKAGETIRTRIEILGEFAGVSKIKATITDDAGESIASAEMKTALRHE